MAKQLLQLPKLVVETLATRVARDARGLVGGIRTIGPSQIQTWLIAMVLGGVVGLLAYYFSLATRALLRILYQADSDNLLYYVHQIPWWSMVLIPTIGGLLTGLILWKYTEQGRVHSISHVIEAAAINNGRVKERSGLASALASFLTLSTGGSTGQEGPIVHIGALVSSRLSNWLHVDGMTARDYLACAAAAGVAASFNAPIAGIILAHEIILRHYAISSFTPIAIASVAGTITGHLLAGGNFTEIKFFALSVSQYTELPAFLLLGLLSGLIAVVMIKSIFIAEDIGELIVSRTSMPTWLRPAIAGMMLGVIALQFPHVIGIGYQTTVKALLGNLDVSEVVILVTIKIIAVAITIGGRMGGGIFSPSLMVGALTGLAFGLVAITVGSDQGAVQLYALAGMAAVSAAVLGAPLSTSVIVFEMTGDWQASLAVLVAVSIACGITTRLVDKSFFLTQLERRGLHISAGPQAYLLATFKVATHMQALTLSDEQVEELIEVGAFVRATDSFEEAYPLLESLGVTSLLVVTSIADPRKEILGQLEYIDVLRMYSHALADTAAEEHN